MLTITGKNIDLTDEMKAVVTDKLAAVHKLHDHITTIDVEIDNQRQHDSGSVFHVRINVQIPHKLLCAEATEVEWTTAIDICRDELVRQLRDLKERYQTKQRQAQQTIREMKTVLESTDPDDEAIT
jgi:ribosomal subunit interface protein